MAIGAAVAAQVKSRWDSEETAIMAKEEARLHSLGGKTINLSLVAIMPQRTLEPLWGTIGAHTTKTWWNVTRCPLRGGPDMDQVEVMADNLVPTTVTRGARPQVESPPNATRIVRDSTPSPIPPPLDVDTPNRTIHLPEQATTGDEHTGVLGVDEYMND